MLVHSSDSGFVVGEKQLVNEDYVDSWKYIANPKTHGLSTSYISDTNMGSAPVQGKGVLYGFYNLKANDIFAMAPYDVNSNIANYGYSTGNQQIFISAENMSKNTMRVYNEFLISREKSTPSCIIVYNDSSQVAFENAYKASSDWLKHGYEVPVVVINKSKVATNQVQIINNLLVNFKRTKEFNQLKQAIELYESNTAGLYMNRVEGTSVIESFNLINNSSLQDVYNPSNLKGTIESIIETGDKEQNKILLNILREINDRYAITNEKGTKYISKTKSLLDIEIYIEQIEAILNQ